MSGYVYVDNSNIFIEGKRVSAVKKGLTQTLSNVLDNDYAVDFGKLHSYVAGTMPNHIKKAILFGSRPPKNDSLWNIARNAGFDVIVFDRNVANREKKVDTAIVTQMMRDAYTEINKDEDTITLVSGDADYVPTVSALVDDGYTVNVIFWDHAAEELKNTCSDFHSLDAQFNAISYKKL